MRSWFLSIVSVIFFSACTSKVERADVAKINGYWEIEKVVLPDGQEKEYTINPIYDYFEIKGDQGFRKKVMPQFDGAYLVNDASEQIRILTEKEGVFLQYTTPYATWKEELATISDTKLVLVNPENKAYHYKKATAPNLTSDGKATPK